MYFNFDVFSTPRFIQHHWHHRVECRVRPISASVSRSLELRISGDGDHRWNIPHNEVDEEGRGRLEIEDDTRKRERTVLISCSEL